MSQVIKQTLKTNSDNCNAMQISLSMQNKECKSDINNWKTQNNCSINHRIENYASGLCFSTCKTDN